MGCVSLGSDIAWLHVCLYKDGFKKSKEYEEASERGLLPFCPNASVTLQSFGASDTREVAEVQTTFVQPIISVTLSGDIIILFLRETLGEIAARAALFIRSAIIPTYK